MTARCPDYYIAVRDDSKRFRRVAVLGYQRSHYIHWHGPLWCSNCQRWTGHEGVQAIKLVFIALLPLWFSKWIIRCLECQTGYEVPNKTWKALGNAANLLRDVLFKARDDPEEASRASEQTLDALASIPPLFAVVLGAYKNARSLTWAQVCTSLGVSPSELLRMAITPVKTDPQAVRELAQRLSLPETTITQALSGAPRMPKHTGRGHPASRPTLWGQAEVVEWQKRLLCTSCQADTVHNGIRVSGWFRSPLGPPTPYLMQCTVCGQTTSLSASEWSALSAVE